MLNRSLSNMSWQFPKDPVTVYFAVNVGAAGAVTLLRWNYPQMGGTSGGSARTYTAAPTTGGGASWPLGAAQGAEGVFSVARTGTGLWTVTLEDMYQRMVALNFYSTLTGGLSAITACAENLAITNMSSGTPPRSIIGVALVSGAGVPADPASGERINFAMTLLSSTTP